VLRELADAEDL